MEARPDGAFYLRLWCASCGAAWSRIPNHTDEVCDPFACDDPWQALNSYQRTRLGLRWKRDDLGERYRFGLWSRCTIVEDIQDWHADQSVPDSEPLSLLLSGAKGTGKTIASAMMMACLAARNEFSFAWCSMAQLADYLARWQGYESRTVGSDNPLYPLRECKYLFLDDVGTEYNGALPMARLNEMVEYRHAHRRPIIITTNLSEVDLCAREGWERIADRLIEDAWAWCDLGGESMRRAE